MNKDTSKQFQHELSEYIEKIEQKSKINIISSYEKSNVYEIIITVFNGLNSLKICIESLLKHTNKKHTISIYNDQSTDKLVKPWLDKLVKKNSHISVYNHKKNVGYLKNINYALTQIQKDCIILNSDTIVTPNWLQELDLIASNKNIAIVCPLSNNATILSLSNASLKNVERLNQFSGQWYPIPTAVGSCMLMKKIIVEEFGGFDLYYNPGYGEECDYSLRVRGKGYSIACAVASFVYHEGSMSFLNSAKEIQKTNSKLLSLRWPSYENEVKQFSENNPIRQIEEVLFEMDCGKETILHVIHGINFKGGVELFTKEIVEKLSNEFNHVILIPSEKELNWKYSKITTDELNIRIINFQHVNVNLNSIICKKSADLYKHELDVMFLQILKSREFKLVHFHSLVGLGSLLWPKICNNQGIEYIVSCHDHFFGCHNHTLLSSQSKQYCEKEYSDPRKSDCLTCLNSSTEYNTLPTDYYIELRNYIWRDILHKASSIIIPNIYLKELICNFIGEEKTNIQVVEPFFYPEKQHYFNKKTNTSPALNIAFLGNFNFNKGASIFLKLNEKLLKEKINWYIYGPINDDYKDNPQLEKINCYGSYNRKNLKDILSQVDLIILPSLFPETYSITLTEAWENKIPVIATALGALKQRITSGFNGYVFPMGQIECLADIVRSKFLNAPDNINVLIKNIAKQQTEKLSSEILINKRYQDIKTVVLNFPKKNRNLDFKLEKKNHHATVATTKWLNAELTLEGESDWRLPKALVIIIFNGSVELIKNSIKSCELYAPNSKTYLISEISLEIFMSSQLICFLNPGQKLNDNFGNWIYMFESSKKCISSCDYMLYDNEEQLYAPMFNKELDLFSYYRNRNRLSSILLNQSLFEASDVRLNYRSIIQSNNLIPIFDNLLKQERKIYHFPHLACLYEDVQWVNGWKLDRENKINFENKLKSISVFIQTSETFNLLDTLIKSLNSQTDIKVSCIYILSEKPVIYSHYENTKFIQILDSMNIVQNIKNINIKMRSDAFVFLNDNVIIENNSVLKSLLSCLKWHGVEAISPVFDLDSGSVYMQKIGKGKAVSGWGKGYDLTFSNSELPIMTQVIDEDFLMLSVKALECIIKQDVRIFSYYNSIVISKFLLSNDCKLSLLKLTNVKRLNLPSFICNDGRLDNLEAQRLSLFQSDKLYFLNSQYYSNSYSSQENMDLDQEFGVFKTPKTLPRVIAYAHDTWASGFYRVQSPITSLVVKNVISCNFLPFEKQNKTASYYEINKQDPNVLLLHNFLNDDQLNALSYYRKYLDTPIILSLDDLITDIPMYNKYSQTNYNNIEERMKLAFENSDKLIVSTDYLAGKFNHLHNNIVVIKNMLSKQLWLNGYAKKKNKTIRIGWAGAAQHKDDLDWLIVIIEKTKSFVQWVFYGDKPEGIALNDVEYYPHTPFSQYQITLQNLNLDIAIAPLVENEFNKAKSNLKLLEYGALNIPVICSRIIPYIDSPAIKVKNEASQWIEAIMFLAQDDIARQQIGADMYKWVVDGYILDDNLKHWSDVLYLN